MEAILIMIILAAIFFPKRYQFDNCRALHPTATTWQCLVDTL